MAGFFDSGPLPAWKELRDLLGKDMPWKLVEQYDKADNAGWLDQFVKEMVSRASQQHSVESHKALASKVTKDAKRVTVTLDLPPGAMSRDLRLHASADRLKISGLPGERRQLLRLPCMVHARTGKATLKGNRLVVKFRRKPAEKNEVELFILE
ncbi:hypothetical protein ACFPVX_07300 [Cohnella faecalis]|uniref:Hsp20/alpha crystallin family protein n=1 Tax=Cohnella faecalis TaxID=2315694 RepID=A0A398CC70_9BACL|nr:hypothetical protein [Cohnella faecalis]RIE00756.1 hypothetical protein D3H35_26550 [Cohnella faecalis]